MAINSDFRDLLFELNARDARYLIVGGYAFSFHAKPRFTKDLDLWIDPHKANALHVWNALAAFGAPLADLTRDDLEHPGTIFQVGRPPNRIDILTRLEGVAFEDAWPARCTGMYGDQKIWFLSKSHLITNKRAVGRLQDIADVEVLESFDRNSSGDPHQA